MPFKQLHHENNISFDIVVGKWCTNEEKKKQKTQPNSKEFEEINKKTEQ